MRTLVSSLSWNDVGYQQIENRSHRGRRRPSFRGATLPGEGLPQGVDLGRELEDNGRQRRFLRAVDGNQRETRADGDGGPGLLRGRRRVGVDDVG